MRRAAGSSYLRGKLARRLLAVIALAAVVPVLFASVIAYRQLLRAADLRQTRTMHEEAKDAALAVLGQFEIAAASLALADSQSAASAFPSYGRAGDLMAVDMLSTATAAQWTLATAAMNGEQRRRLLSGEPVLYWADERGPQRSLYLARLQAGNARLARGRIDLQRLLDRVAPPVEDFGIALEDPALPSTLVRDGRNRVPTAVFQALAEAAPARSAQHPWTDARGAWCGITWDLFLDGSFAAPPLRILIGEPTDDAAAALGGLRLTIPLSLVGAMAFALWLAVAHLRRYLGPLQTLTAATRQLGARNFDVLVDIRTDDELSALGADFNRMASSLREQVTTLEAVAQVDRLLLQTQSLEKVLDALLPCIARVLKCVRVSVLLIDQDASRYADVHEHCPGEPAAQAVRRVPIEQALLAAAPGERDGPPDDGAVSALFGVPPAAASSSGARSQIWPLRHGGQIAGFLCLAWSSPEEAPPASDATVRGFADRLTVALANLSYEHELLRRAHFDGLTGLANREFFRQTLQARLSGGGESGRSSALLYVDLDGFKKVNDSAGHEAGDALLVEIAARLKASARAGDTVARLGGDEFAILLADGTQAADAAAVAKHILVALEPVVVVAGVERWVSGSVGVALVPADGDSVELLLRNADIAMYQAKERGGDQVAFFSPAMHETMNTRISLEIGLQRAIERGELALYYQPIVRDDRLTGVEALLRWVRRSGPSVGPAEFIPIAEQSNLILSIGDWVLKQACADYARWSALGIAPDYVSINVAPRQLRSSEFVDDLHKVMLLHGVSPARIQIEITESAVAGDTDMETALARVSQLGVRLAMDDFGTGHSSLSHLHRYPFDVVKIDRSFVVELPDSKVASQLVRTIIRMAHGLEKAVVAEGVETEPQRDLLRSLGCDYMQGYLFGTPCTEAHLRPMLAAAPKVKQGSGDPADDDAAASSRSAA